MDEQRQTIKLYFHPINGTNSMAKKTDSPRLVMKSRAYLLLAGTQLVPGGTEQPHNSFQL